MEQKTWQVYRFGKNRSTTMTVTTGQPRLSGHPLTAPVLQAEERAEVVGHIGSNAVQIVGADAGGQERLVSVPHGGIHQQQTLVLTHFLGKRLRALGDQDVAPAGRRLGGW